METKKALAAFCFLAFLSLWTSVNSLLTAKGVNLEGNPFTLFFGFLRRHSLVHGSKNKVCVNLILCDILAWLSLI